MQPHDVSALISLPRLAGDTALIVSAGTALLAVALGARALLAWQSLAAAAASARRRQARLEIIEDDVHARFRRLRASARGLDAGIERSLWALPALDQRIDRARDTLANQRPLLDGLHRDEARALRATFARIRGTLSLLRSARDLRRTIWG